MAADAFSSGFPSPHAPPTMSHALLQLLCGRKGRSLVLVVLFALIAICFLWQPSPETLERYPSLSHYQLPYWQSTSRDAESTSPAQQQEFSLLQSSNATPDIEEGDVSALRKSNPSFHLLLLAPTATPDLCKTVLSAFLLNYPPPTLINWKKEWDGENAEEESDAAKIRGVYDYLEDSKDVANEDLILVVDGYDVWFQLPSEVLLKEYQRLVVDANERLSKKYGFTDYETLLPRFRQSVVFGADTGHSTEGEMDKDARKPLDRPKVLNSGTIIGPAKDLRVLYEEAVKRPQYHRQHSAGHQHVFMEIFEEQEYAREAIYQSTRGAGGRWRDWLSQRLGFSSRSTNTTANLTLAEDHRYEYSIGLDRASTLFTTLTSSAPASLAFSNDTSLSNRSSAASHHSVNPHLPPSLLDSRPPFVNIPILETPDGIPSTTLPIHDHLDALPPPETPWTDIPLLTDTATGSVPAALHVTNSAEDSTPLNRTALWDSLWFHPHARALLRRYFRRRQGPLAALAASRASSTRLPSGSRGGQGGVWTDRDEWMGWGEVCGEWHEEVFGDGQGRWGHELKGIGEAEPKYNAEGKLVSGEGSEMRPEVGD